ncbi:MAG: phosphatase PAP2 family protein [Candidatus Acidiferrales bacterium]
MFRPAEEIHLCTFALFVLLAWLTKKGSRQRRNVTLVGCAGCAIVLLPHFARSVLSAAAFSIIEDWLPAPLMLVVYWQQGGFHTPPSEKLEDALLRFDAIALSPFVSREGRIKIRGWLAAWFEFAYLFCYPLVPLGIGALYAAGRRDACDLYWVTVLPATYLCYALIPFVTSRPPRTLARDMVRVPALGAIRRLNLWLLGRASIQINTFPSAHVASTFAAAIVLISVAPVCGWIFLFMAASIAAGAVLGRYHYAADAILAIGLAFATFFIGRALL